MRKFKRREIIKMGAGAAFALGSSRLFPGCLGDDQNEMELSNDAGADVLTTETAPVVAAILGNDLKVMTREALDAIGGIEKVVGQGETVFLKPNMITLPWGNFYNPFKLGECTKPEVLIAVTEACLQAGAKEVIIGDASHRASFNWEYAVTLDGTTNLQAEAQRLDSKYDGKVTLSCLDADSPEMVEIPTTTYLGTIAISSLVFNADRTISIPVMKTHRIAQLTLSLKNFLGVTSLSQYGTMPINSTAGDYLDRLETFDHSSPESIASIYLDIVKSLKPDLAIIDASIGVEGNGPTTVNSGGTTIDMKDRLGSWALLASTDLVAADTAAAIMMNHEVSEIKQLLMAHDRGLGNMHERSFNIVGEKLENLRVDWAPASLSSFPLPTKEDSETERG